MKRAQFAFLGMLIAAAFIFLRPWNPGGEMSPPRSDRVTKTPTDSTRAPKLMAPSTRPTPPRLELSNTPDAGAPVPTEALIGGPLQGDLGLHVVALRERESGRHLRVGLMLRLAGNKAKEQFQIRRPALERTLQLLAAQRTHEEMTDPIEQERFRVQLLRRYRKVLHTIRVLDLAFTEIEVLAPGKVE